MELIFLDLLKNLKKYHQAIALLLLNKNNQVVEYGMGEVREKEVNGVQTFFLFTY